jgi:hypothetical protein
VSLGSEVVTPISPTPRNQIADSNGTGQAMGQAPGCEMSRHAVFAECPQCGGGMAPEHAHYRCTSCGWRDSCCD